MLKVLNNMAWLIALVISTLLLTPTQAETLEETARGKITILEELIVEAENAGIDVLKEKMTSRTADIFLNFANWDESNVETNRENYALVNDYREYPQEMAQLLPDFERNEVILMLDEAIDHLTRLQNGEVFREPIPKLDWSQISHESDQLTFNRRPVFTADYTWKPDSPELNEFHGDMDGFFFMHPYVQNENGDIKQNIVDELANKPDGKAGFIFLNHNNEPDWAVTKYGPEFVMSEDTAGYTSYDIDHPGAREINRLLLGGTVPYMAGKKYTEMGYMLCNEPHWETAEGVWSWGPVSTFTMEKFKTWLTGKHTSITNMNSVWGTNYGSFNEVSLTIPISLDLRGTPRWYDWLRFNMDRVTEWFAFLKSEIQIHDPQAKVHIKIMPNLWSENGRSHGIDFEALTELSGIIGNDASADYNHMWKTEEWMEHYAFGWREMTMSYDFLKSVSPDKIIFNSESHYLSTVSSRDLYQDPKYARATFWLAHSWFECQSDMVLVAT